jgi:hypothetical protein
MGVFAFYLSPDLVLLSQVFQKHSLLKSEYLPVNFPPTLLKN